MRMTLGLCSGRQKAGQTSAPKAGSARKFEAPCTRTSPCGEGLRSAAIPAQEADELGAIVRIAPQEFLREVRKIETVEAPLPFGSANHGAPPFDGLATATVSHPAFSDPGSRLPRTGDARRGDSNQVGGAKLPSGNLRYGGVAPCMIDRVWARLAGAHRIAGNGRVDSSARHHARRSGYGPAADPVKGRRCVPNGGKDLDSASGSR
jgi:hypothetical protein